MRKHIHRAKRIKDIRTVNKENPRVRPIIDLLNSHFYISRYHRGYRWGEQEINDLLDDLIEYHTKYKQISHFYCLQPILVRRKTWLSDNEQKINGWEVFDGQQRLITILIILNYLDSTNGEYMKEKLGENLCENTDFYTIDFETKAECKDFIQNKKYKHKIIDTNVEFYHLSKAYQDIKMWFDKVKLDGMLNAPNIILDTLLDSEKNAAVIWYEYNTLNSDKTCNYDSSIELFIRLDERRIPLTDAELIKALLLQSDLYPAGEKKFIKQRFSEIANEWDEMEAMLMDEKMWYFINDLSYRPTSKINLLFKMLAEQWNEYDAQNLIQYDVKKNKPKHFDFHVFEKHLEQIEKRLINNLSDQSHVLDPINEIWSEIRNLFATLHEWYTDHNLYHYIGFLLTVNSGNKRDLLKELCELEVDKDKFLKHVKRKIAQEISLDKNLDELKDGEDNKTIIKMLLLMDIESLLKQGEKNSRFPFYIYKKENINSIELINSSTLQPIDTKEVGATAWAKHHNQWLPELKSFEDSTNGKYIPITSRRAFSKYYSESPKEFIFWNSEDENEELLAIKKVYDSYIQLLK